MKKASCLLLFMTVLTFSCSTPTYITNFWKSDAAPAKTYKSIFIAALVSNVNAKNAIENNLANAAAAKGYKVVKSIDAFPPNFSKENPADKTAMLNKIQQQGCDAIFTVTLLDKESETRYVPGSGAYAPYPRYGFYGSFWGYYSYWSPRMYDPGYYTTDKTYVMESNVYDAQTESLLFSIQSSTMNPNGIDDFTKSYTAALVKELEKQGLLKN